MAKKAPTANKTTKQQLATLYAAGHFLNGEKSKAPSKARPVQCKCGNPVCVDQWHTLARWLEKDRGNVRKLEAWLKAMWDEDREADRTFKAAPGLWLVWSGAKVELTEEIAVASTHPILRSPAPSHRMTDKEETRQPDRVAHDYREGVPEYVVTMDELRQLARYWYDERIVHDFWFFTYQTTGGSDLREHFMIKDHLSRLTQVLGPKAMQELHDDAVKKFRKRCTKITDEDWRVFTSGTEDEQQAWRDKIFREDAEITVEEARELHATFGTRQAND